MKKKITKGCHVCGTEKITRPPPTPIPSAGTPVVKSGVESAILGVFFFGVALFLTALLITGCGGLEEPEPLPAPDASVADASEPYHVLDASPPDALFCQALANDPVLLLIVTELPIVRIEIEAYGDQECSAWCLRASSSSSVGVRGDAYPIAAPIGESYRVSVYGNGGRLATVCAVPHENGAIEI